MYKNLLVATDGSKLSTKAVVHAIGLAKPLGAKITAFYAAPDYPLPMYADGVVYEPVSKKEYAAMMAKEATKVLDAVAAKAKAAGVDCTTVHMIAPAPWEAILPGVAILLLVLAFNFMGDGLRDAIDPYMKD